MDPKQALSMSVSQEMPRADICIVFPYKTSANVQYGDNAPDEEFRGLKPPSPHEKDKMDSWNIKRQGMITHMSDCGLLLSLYYSRDRDEVFVKVAADGNHLRQVAETKRHKLELKEEYLSAFAQYQHDVAGTRETNYEDRIITSHLYKPHIDPTDEDAGDSYPRQDAIFRTVDRIQLINHMVTQPDPGCAGIDVAQMIHDGDINKYFPLHELRRLLAMDREWFSHFVWASEIQHVRDYFGERIAMYFLFMSHLVKWLFYPSIAGICLWSAGVLYGSPDNWSAMVICAGVSLWSVFFIQTWRRKEAVYAMQWGTADMTASMEPTRPGFKGTSRVNPVTGQKDRYYPWSERIFSVIFSYTVLLVSIMCLGVCIAVIFYLRHTFRHRVLFMVCNAVIVEILNSAFTWIARKLTERENHRSYSEHAYHLLAKTIVFKFINSYISLYYIAFFKNHAVLFGQPQACMYNERTGQTDCLKDLGWQLGIFVITRTIMLNAWEIVAPTLVLWYRKFQEGREFNTGFFFMASSTVMPDMSSAEKQAIKEDYDVYEDMDEILILYGYCTLFVVACPWVPMVCFCCVIFEVFLDQKKLVLLFRRPFPQPAANNEPWDTAFDCFGILAMLTNSAVIIFGGHTFDGWSSTGKILLFILIEFLSIFSRVIVDAVFATTPMQVRLLQLQQREVVHKHLNLGGDSEDHETRAMAQRTTIQQPPIVYDRDTEDDEMY